MSLRLVFCLSAVILLAGAVLTAQADVPQLINYQGILKSGGSPVTTPTNVIFAIWDDPAAGDSLWSELQNVTPDGDGRFSILLGSVSPIPDSAFSSADMYLSVKVDTDAEMTPRQRLASVAYAYRDNDWELIDNVLYTQGEYGIARAGNVLYGDHDSTHVNLGVACTTGASGLNYKYTTVGGGRSNTASGKYSFAAGRRAQAANDGAFVWADDNNFDFPTATESNFTPAAKMFLVRSTGGAVFVSGIDGSGNSNAGVQLAAGGGSWSSLSDRNLKENFE